MNDRPILFSAPMVRALLSGTKTQTRRFHTAKPPGEVGGRLWVREAWQTHCDKDGITPRDLPPGTDVQYPATYEHWVSKRRPSLHMPRWASRITLLITDVRVQKLQDISEEDAKAEGVSWPEGAQDEYVRKWSYPQTAKARFADLWENINGSDSWESNPWVWAISFQVINGNIDKIEVAA